MFSDQISDNIFSPTEFLFYTVDVLILRVIRYVRKLCENSCSHYAQWEQCKLCAL